MNTKADMPITDEQIAEIEALAFTTHASTADLFAYARETNPSKILALISRLRAAEMDAKRYRWLRKNVCMGCPSPEGSQYKDAYLVVTGYGYEESEDLTDAAVDAICVEN